MPNNGISGTNTNKTTNYRIEKPKFLVVTNSVSPTPEQAILALYRDGNSASIHYFIRKEGKQDQFHLEDNQAFTCGQSKFGEEVSLNKTAITVMFINNGNESYTQEQKDQFKAYLEDFKKRNPAIDLKINLLGLGEVATLTKADVPEGEGKIFPRHEAPGKLFFWDELAELGFGLFIPTTPEQKAESWVSPESSELEIKALQENLQNYGYALEASGKYDDATKAWVTRFNQRYVPDPTQAIDASIWSKASQISLDNILNHIQENKKQVTQTLTSSPSLFKFDGSNDSSNNAEDTQISSAPSAPVLSRH